MKIAQDSKAENGADFEKKKTLCCDFLYISITNLLQHGVFLGHVYNSLIYLKVYWVFLAQTEDSYHGICCGFVKLLVTIWLLQGSFIPKAVSLSYKTELKTHFAAACLKLLPDQPCTCSMPALSYCTEINK